MKSAWHFAAIALAVLCFADAAAGGSLPHAPHKSMMEDPLTFTGVINSEQKDEGRSIVIGLFVPGPEKSDAARAVITGAQKAIDRHIEKQGGKKQTFKLVRRWADSPWKGGGREMIRLVYEDNAVAVISFLSASSHIAEQVAAKSFVPVLTPIASDTSLTRARVPWIFRLPPDDDSQAHVLVNGYRKHVPEMSVGLITSTGQDARMSARSLKRELRRTNIPVLFHAELGVEEPLREMDRVVEKIARMKPGGLIIRLMDRSLPDVLAALNERGVSIPAFIPWTPGVTGSTLASAYAGKLFHVEPFLKDSLTVDKKRNGEDSLHVQLYAFDAVSMVIAGIDKVGNARKKLRDWLAGASTRGLSGAYLWDSGGGNKQVPFLTEARTETVEQKERSQALRTGFAFSEPGKPFFR